MMAILSLKCARPMKNSRTSHVMMMKMAKNKANHSSSRPIEDDCRTTVRYEALTRDSVKLPGWIFRKGLPERRTPGESLPAVCSPSDKMTYAGMTELSANSISSNTVDRSQSSP